MEQPLLENIVNIYMHILVCVCLHIDLSCKYLRSAHYHFFKATALRAVGPYFHFFAFFSSLRYFHLLLVLLSITIY